MGFAYLAGFRCSVIEFGATATYLRRRLDRRSYSLTLLRDALLVIIINILNEVGAVIAQSGRQFDEMSFYISTEKFGDLHLIIAKVYTSFMIVLPIA